MRTFVDVELILVCKAIHNEVATAETANQQIIALTRSDQRMQWLVSFVGVVCALLLFVPQTQGAVNRPRQKLALVYIDDAGNLVLVCAVRFEFFFKDDERVFTRLHLNLKFRNN